VVVMTTDKKIKLIYTLYLTNPQTEEEYPTPTQKP
jgi:hypothetical protein